MPSSGRYRRLLGYTRPYRPQWGGVALLLLLSSAVAIAMPWPMQVIFDHVLDNRAMPNWLARLTAILPAADTKVGLLGWAAGANLVLYALSSLVDSVISYAWVNVGQRMVYDLARDLFARAQRQSLLFHARHRVGDTMSRVMTDSWCVFNVVESLLLTPAQALLTTAAIVCLMWRVNVPLTLAAGMVAPLIILGSMILGKRVRHVALARREIESGMQAHVQQVLSGVHVVQAFGQEIREQQRFSDFAGEAVRVSRRGVFVTNLSNLYTGLVLTAGTAVILLIGSRQVIAGSLSIGTLWVFLAYLNTLQNQFRTLTNTYASLQNRRAEIERVSEILEAPTEIAEPADAIELTKVRGEIAIERVSFGYEPGRPVLREISLNLPAGATIALVGATGAGKTTLASLLPRFFDPWEGCVRIDGVDVRQIRLRDLRKQVAIVLQESFIFPITIAQNISFGRPDATRQEIERAAEMANAVEFIAQLPEGYDTIVGERGTTLSGGQKQRLSIARAILKDAPILILDEPTAALDTLTEQAILQAMRRLMTGRTTLIIAHRLSTIRDADKIAVMEAGRIIELGTHDQLIALGGAYARFCNVQTGEPMVAGRDA